MIIAVTIDPNTEEVFQHFGHSEYFLLVDLDKNQQAIISSRGHSHHELIPYLAKFGVKVFICGGIGGPAIEMFEASGIKVIPGISGSMYRAVEAYKKGTLRGNSSGIHNGCKCH